MKPFLVMKVSSEKKKAWDWELWKGWAPAGNPQYILPCLTLQGMFVSLSPTYTICSHLRIENLSKKTPPSDWPIDKPVGQCLIGDRCRRAQPAVGRACLFLSFRQSMEQRKLNWENSPLDWPKGSLWVIFLTEGWCGWSHPTVGGTNPG